MLAQEVRLESWSVVLPLLTMTAAWYMFGGFDRASQYSTIFVHLSNFDKALKPRRSRDMEASLESSSDFCEWLGATCNDQA